MEPEPEPEALAPPICPLFGPTTIQAAGQRLALAKTLNARLGAFYHGGGGARGVRFDPDVLGLVGGLARTSAELARADPVFAGAITRAEMVAWLAAANRGAAPRCELLYRASRDGWSAAAFHGRCDETGEGRVRDAAFQALCSGKGGNLTVIRTSRGFVFGGYADAPWRNNSGKPGSCAIASGAGEAFLFALRCHAGLGPTRMPLTGRKNEQAMVGRAGGGPCFGNELSLGNSDGVDSAHALRSGAARVGCNGVFSIPAGQDGSTMLVGDGDLLQGGGWEGGWPPGSDPDGEEDQVAFEVTEVEVYAVQPARVEPPPVRAGPPPTPPPPPPGPQ
eukprot:COSAG04_NODE_3491_length_2774_cov_1.948785_1_plen_334_part_00